MADRRAREMLASDVVDLLRLCRDHGIELWLDGGWAVDALLGHQTRPHADVDIVVDQDGARALRDLLERRGWAEVLRDDSRACNYVLGDGAGREVDFHVVTFDAEGNGLYDGQGAVFPVAGFAGSGTIAGVDVRCLTPEQLVAFHTGYELDDDDRADVRALCGRFGIELPPEHR